VIFGSLIAIAAIVAVAGAGLHLSVPAHRPWTGEDLAPSCAVGGAVGALVILTAALGAPWSRTLLWFGWLAFCVSGLAGFAARRDGFRRPLPEVLRDSSASERAAAVLVVGGLGLLAWKSAVVPLWSWDHFAMWGAKARLLAARRLDLAFLGDPLAHPGRPDHPLGLPALWLALSGLRVPEAPLFKLSHVAFGVGLALCFRAAARRLGASSGLANLLTAFLCVSPLYADTEVMGLAEMPFALWACAAVAWWVRGEAGRRTAFAAGVSIGFLPWLKQEGWPLAFLLLAAAAYGLGRQSGAERRRLLGWCATPALLLSVAAWAYQHFVLPADAGFVGDDGMALAVERAAQMPSFLRLAGSELLAADWLGFWLFLPVVTAFAVIRRCRPALVLAGLVWLQAALYLLICFLSRSPPGDQLRAAFFRTSAVLVPLGLLASAALSRVKPAAGVPLRDLARRSGA
jgi:hypothetical protein